MLMRRWLVPAVIAAQVAVPLVALLGSEPPTRLGFQMYAGIGYDLEVRVENRHGDEVDHDLGEVLAFHPRVEIDWTRRLPEALCAETADAHRVTVTQREVTRTVLC